MKTFILSTALFFSFSQASFAFPDIGNEGCAVKFLQGPRNQIKPPVDAEMKTLWHKGEERSYLVRTPPKINEVVKKVPLVIEIHGAFQSAAIEANCYGLDKEVLKDNGIIVYPQAAWFAWNTSTIIQNRMDERRGRRKLGKIIKVIKDDVGFLDKMIDELVEQYPIDPKRIYVVGYSSGGFMAYRVAAELSHKVAAAASVSGALGLDMEKLPQPEPVPMLQVHGVKDMLVYYSIKSGGIASVRSVLDSVDIWKEVNRCEKAPVKVENKVMASTGLSYTHTYFAPRDPQNGAPMEFVVFPEYTHMFPSSVRPSVSPLIWDFFKKFQRKD